MLKKFALGLVLATLAASATAPHAAVPMLLNYQGRLSAPDGTPKNGSFTMVFSFYDAEVGGNALPSGTSWSETQNVTVTDGVFNVLLGSVTALPTTLFEGGPSDAAGPLRFLHVVVDGEALTPRRRVASAAYAIRPLSTADPARLDAVSDVIPTGNLNLLLDSTGDVGRYPALTVGSDGLALVSYYDSTNMDLKLARCTTLDCSSSTTLTIDSAGDVGRYTSITVAGDGLPLISYYDSTNGALKVAHCSNATCGSSTIATLAAANDVGQYTSITAGSDGFGLISFYDATLGALKVAHCTNSTCASAVINHLDSALFETSITLGTDGLGLIAYRSCGGNCVKTWHCGNVDCSAGNSAQMGSCVAAASVTVGGLDGYGMVSCYRTGGYLQMNNCTSLNCSSSVATDVNSGVQDGASTSMTTAFDGFPLIAHLDITNLSLKLTRCTTPTCSSRVASVFDSSMGADGVVELSITVGADGMPLIGYFDNKTQDLRLVHCGNPYCVGTYRRR